MAHPFLSPDWLDAANDVRTRLAHAMPPVEVVLSANLVVTDTPFGDDGVVYTHLDSASGRVRIEPGLLEEPDVVLRMDYSAARALMVDQDHVAIVEAFRDGRIHVDGDLEKLQALSTINRGEAAVPEKLSKELRAITANEPLPRESTKPVDVVKDHGEARESTRGKPSLSSAPKGSQDPSRDVQHLAVGPALPVDRPRDRPRQSGGRSRGGASPPSKDS